MKNHKEEGYKKGLVDKKLEYAVNFAVEIGFTAPMIKDAFENALKETKLKYEVFVKNLSEN